MELKWLASFRLKQKKNYFILILKNTQMTHRKSILDPFLIPSQNIRVHWLGGVVDVYTIISLLMNWRIGTVHKRRLQSRGGKGKGEIKIPSKIKNAEIVMEICRHGEGCFRIDTCIFLQTSFLGGPLKTRWWVELFLASQTRPALVRLLQ